MDHKALFMRPEASSLDTLHDIKRMMEKSSRFISLSGWSGIAAGICGLGGAYFAARMMDSVASNPGTEPALRWNLMKLAALVFVAAFSTAFIFTYLRSRKEGTPIWGQAARRLLVNTMIPMIAGGVLILRLIDLQQYALVSPSMLLFYGLALIQGSKYTLGEIRYLGYLELALAFANLWFMDQALLFWAAGFGVLHIVYGAIMWWKYERGNQ